MSHLVVSSSQLEGEDGLQVLSLEEDIGLETIRQVDGVREWRFFDDIVDSGCEDQS